MIGAAKRKLASMSGQMTVELCVVFPAAIIIAVIAVNALSFFGSCAEFDRVGRNAVRIAAASPEYGQESGQTVARVDEAIGSAMPYDNMEWSVEKTAGYQGYETYVMTLEYSPTLFGLGLKSEVFGVPLPKLTHETRLSVDPYKPGMLF